MKIQERAPYLSFGLAMAFLGLPLFAVLFDTFAVLVGKGQGIALGWRQGHWVWLDWDGKAQQTKLSFRKPRVKKTAAA